MMRFISYCSSKCYENTDGQPGGHRSRRGRGPRLVRPFGAILPTALRLWAPPSNTAEGGHAILGPLPLWLLCPPGCPSVFS